MPENKSSYIIYKLNNNYPEFTRDLRELVSGSRELSEHASLYDYSPAIQGNGIRSFIKVIEKFIDRIYKVLEKKSDINRDIIITAHVFVIILRLMKLIEIKRRTLGIPMEEILNHLNDPIDDEISSSMLSIPTDAMSAIFTQKFFWLSSSLKFHQLMYSRIVGMYETSPFAIFKLIDEKKVNAKYAKFSNNSTADQVNKVWGFYGAKINKPVISVINKLSPKIRKEIFIPRQNRWEIQPDGKSIKFFAMDNISAHASRINSYFDMNVSNGSISDTEETSFESGFGSPTLDTPTNGSPKTRTLTLNLPNPKVPNMNIPKSKIPKTKKSTLKESTFQVSKPGQSKVKCIFLQDSTFGASPKDSLVIHLHGGGYIALRPKCHEMYLRRWASRLKGVPILSIDYSLSPKNRFPIAIQEILDVYLFLVSNSDHVIDLIGFKPKNIVLFGDSAGSNLSICLMNILNDMNEQILNNQPLKNETPKNMAPKIESIPYPSALFLPYPHTNPTLNIFNPSRLFMAFDPVLPIGPMFALTEAYNPHPAHDSTGNDSFDMRKRSVQSSDTGYASNGTFSRSNSTESAQSNGSSVSSSSRSLNGENEETISEAKEEKNKPWYRTSAKSDRMEAMKENTNLGPFFNPLKGDLSNFANIPLYVQVGEFDVLLDDAICLAKKWPGRVKLDILDGMTHGFLFNRILSRECKKATDLCNDRLLEALNL